jgi:hypothetical protein
MTPTCRQFNEYRWMQKKKAGKKYIFSIFPSFPSLPLQFLLMMKTSVSLPYHESVLEIGVFTNPSIHLAIPRCLGQKFPIIL